MDKPNLIESIIPCSGHYSLKKDLHLNAWLAVATATYVAELYLTTRHPDWSPLTRGLIALAPLIPGFLYIRGWLQFIRGLDELQRRIQLEAFLFTALGTIIVGTVIDTLNASGVSLGFLRHGLGLGGAFMVMFTLWLLAGAVVNCRYK
jgi:hypothetical protein